jgi:hypothetical protein
VPLPKEARQPLGNLPSRFGLSNPPFGTTSLGAADNASTAAKKLMATATEQHEKGAPHVMDLLTPGLRVKFTGIPPGCSAR